ncbi:ABC transporter permease [Rhodococcus sp. T2V]|uniref:ABC transporter permease n=1 Tax=Rhodococcus sp. T2V TaxID=3034164 RepID=UPI0023E2937B|nr:ABC transporter permease [Rhodococcus sp. T2V]MDF3307752.1 ABC transporter permease [Rhodococcus sp. T2V]
MTTGIRSAVDDAAAMTGRSLTRMLRTPETMIMGVALPVMLLLLFVYVFGGAMQTRTGYLDYVVPGIILLCAGFGSSQTAVSVTGDMVHGIVDRFRSMPVARSAFLFGHVVSSVARNLVTSLVVIGVAVIMGFRPTAGPMQWLAALALIALFILAISWLAAALGLVADSEEAANGFTFLLLFLPYVSSAFVPTDTMPSWLHGFAENQPVTPVIETVRGLLLGTPVGDTALPAVSWCAGIAAVGAVWAITSFTRKTAR